MALTAAPRSSPPPPPLTTASPRVVQPLGEYSTIKARAAAITDVFDRAVQDRDFNFAYERLKDMSRQSDVVFQTFLLGSARWPDLLSSAGKWGEDDALAEFIERAGAVLLERVSTQPTEQRYDLEFDAHVASTDYASALGALGAILRQNHAHVEEFISDVKRWKDLLDQRDPVFLDTVANLVYWRFPPAGFYLGNLFFGDAWTPPVNRA